MQSHPTWVRGLKLNLLVECRMFLLVSPYVGAWIETRFALLEVYKLLWSHPTWVRGLKHGRGKGKDRHKQSHPTWVRGLKPVAGNDKYKTLDVAPYVGAWIETS